MADYYPALARAGIVGTEILSLKIKGAAPAPKPSIPRAPKVPPTLSTEAGRWRRKLIREYCVDDDYGLLLLQTALEAFDRMRQAQAVIATEGLQYTDRYGQAKCHPATVVEKDSRSQMLASFKAMNLDIEPLSKPGRPSTR